MLEPWAESRYSCRINRDFPPIFFLQTTEHRGKANTLSSYHHFPERGFQVSVLAESLSQVPGPPFRPPRPDLSRLPVSTSTGLFPCSLNPSPRPCFTDLAMQSTSPAPKALPSIASAMQQTLFFQPLIQTFLHTLPLRVIPADQKKERKSLSFPICNLQPNREFST